MNPQNHSPPGGREAGQDANEAETKTKKTPSTDMQAEDAGTAESGVGSGGTAAETAMKQTDKTASESGGRH